VRVYFTLGKVGAEKTGFLACGVGEYMDFFPGSERELSPILPTTKARNPD